LCHALRGREGWAWCSGSSRKQCWDLERRQRGARMPRRILFIPAFSLSLHTSHHHNHRHNHSTSEPPLCPSSRNCKNAQGKCVPQKRETIIRERGSKKLCCCSTRQCLSSHTPLPPHQTPQAQRSTESRYIGTLLWNGWVVLSLDLVVCPAPKTSCLPPYSKRSIPSLPDHTTHTQAWAAAWPSSTRAWRRSPSST